MLLYECLTVPFKYILIQGLKVRDLEMVAKGSRHWWYWNTVFLNYTTTNSIANYCAFK